MKSSLHSLKRGSARLGDYLQGISGEDKENRTPTLQEIKEASIDHAVTMPRFHRAENETAVNDVSATPCFATSTIRPQSHSEPVPKVLRNITNTAGREQLVRDDELNGLLSDIADVSGRTAKAEPRTPKDESPVKTKKKSKAVTDMSWKYTEDNDGCLEILKDLGQSLDAETKETLANPSALFAHLEETGQLKSSVLKLFCKCPFLASINMAPSYAGKVNELGLLEAEKLSARKCTVPLFGGFEQVKVLDFTNVHIVDDDLRFLIKLGNLQAIGLSGTKISDKGLKYLAAHASFKTSLQCIKLCYIEAITAKGLEHLCLEFTRLREIDLWGCERLSLKDLKPLCQAKRLTKVRLPASLQTLIDERHCHYRELAQKYPDLVLKSADIRDFSDALLRAQLVHHKGHFSDIYLAAPHDALMKRLTSILDEIEVQEKLYSII